MSIFSRELENHGSSGNQAQLIFVTKCVSLLALVRWHWMNVTSDWECDGVVFHPIIVSNKYFQSCKKFTANYPLLNLKVCTIKAPVFGTLNSAISNFQTWFVRTVMEVLKYCWMSETSNMQCNYNSFIQIINFHGLFRNALRCRKTGACWILVPHGIHVKEEVQSRITIISKERVKISLQIGAKIMKIG